MYEIAVLDLAECLSAVDAMLEAAQTLDSRPVAVAVVNDYGELMAFARAGLQALSQEG